ncbi:MAG: hypothetical protein ACKOQ4_03750 [Mycobacterium sp.]
MGRHSIPQGEPAEDSSGPPSGRIPRSRGDWQGRRRREDGARRGVSLGVIAALVAVVVLAGGFVLWRFFGDALSRRSTDAASECLHGTANVAVVADPSIADAINTFAERFNDEATPVGDKCANVVVTQSDSDSVLNGLTGSWPAELGERPALWLPASSIQSARLQAAAGKEVVSDARSLVTSPVLLAVPPELKATLGQDGWAALPGLQSDPAALDGRGLAGWGALRLALPTTGSADAAYLAAEAVATAAAPPTTPPTAGLDAVRTLIAGQPRLPDNTADQAWQALTGPQAPAAAPVHAVAMTEQQLFSRTAGMGDAAGTVAGWLPAGPVAVADYPTVLMSGPWLAEEQVAAASEFARFMRKPGQQADLAEVGFRAPDAESGPEANGVVDFPELAAPVPAGDDQTRAAVAAVISPAAGGTTTIVLNEGLTGDEAGRPRLLNVTAALRDRINALPPDAAVGLWTFNKIDSGAVVPTGPLGDPLGPQPRAAEIAGVLDATTPTSGGGLSFTTLRAAYGDALLNYVPGQPNSVLVITQGPHTDRTLDGPGLQDFIRNSQDPDRRVAVNVIDFGGDPDRPTWEAVAQLTGGNYQEVPRSDSPDLAAAIARMLS